MRSAARVEQRATPSMVTPKQAYSASARHVADGFTDRL